MTNPETSSDLVKLDAAAAAFEHGVTQQTQAYQFKQGPDGSWLFRCDEWLNVSKILSAIDATTIERLTAERDEAREAQQTAETALLLSDEAIQYVSVTLGGPDEWSDHESMIYSIRATAEVAESLNARQGEVLKALRPLGAVPIQQAGKPSMRLRDIFPEDFDAIDAALATESSNAGR